MRQVRWWAVAAVAGLLVACGGGDSPPPPVTTSAVKVVGDSLADSGVFGFKFTVQGNAIWTERVTSSVGVPALCPRYAAQSASLVVANPAATACTSYGVGGARINPADPGADDTPFSVVKQLATLASEKPFSPDKLLLVDGGGNDVADLAGRYLAAGGPLGDGGLAFTTLAGELLTTQEINGAFTTGGLPAVGTLYLQRLADKLADAITTHALNRDASRVVVLTVPDVTVTPRFLAVLAGVALQVNSQPGASPGDGEAVAADVKALVNAWVQAFNAQLRSRLGAQSRVAIVDFYASLNQWVSAPASYGLTNATTPACPRVGTDSSGLPTYDIANCTATLLDTPPLPVGETAAGWWQTYVFSDNFHGTPRTNELMAQTVVQALVAKGWK
jgi:phospholipase/lecithinase/hemolysin